DFKRALFRVGHLPRDGGSAGRQADQFEQLVALLPNLFVDVDETPEAVLQAMGAHDGEPDVYVYSQPREYIGDLERPGKPKTVDRLRRLPRNGLAIQDNGARVGANIA